MTTTIPRRIDVADRLCECEHLFEVDALAPAARDEGLGEELRKADNRIWQRYQSGVGMCRKRHHIWVSEGRGPRGEHPRTLELAGFRIKEG